MKVRSAPGFTIIETVLFLAVTGLLIMGALIGTGAALNNQRYRDAVETFKNLLQSQYDELGSIKNDREGAIIQCANATPLSAGESGSGTVARGQADCVIAGRLMVIQSGDIAIHTVLAQKKGSVTNNKTDINVMNSNYDYSIIPNLVDNRKMEWGTEIAWPQKGVNASSDPRNISLLFLRSPESGSVYTFTSDNTSTDSESIKGMIALEFSQSPRTLCINSQGMGMGGNMAVYINPFAAGASAIETKSNDTIKALGNADLEC